MRDVERNQTKHSGRAKSAKQNRALVIIRPRVAAGGDPDDESLALLSADAFEPADEKDEVLLGGTGCLLLA